MRRRARDPATVPEYLRRLGLTPHKVLGQHFLIDQFVLGDIADACQLDADATVLEVGAGPGGLTEELASRAGAVVAVEIDEELAALSRRRLVDAGHVCVLAADILDFTPGELLEECAAGPPYVACGNLPYYITQPVVRRLLEAETPPQRIVVMVQREVARRMAGGEGRESLLSISIRYYGDAELLFDVPSSAFWPEPKVQSSVVRIDPSGGDAMDPAVRARFFSLVRAGFAEPRKQLHNALRNSLDLSRDEVEALLAGANLDPALRAQHLALDDWRRLHDAVERSHPAALDVGALDAR